MVKTPIIPNTCEAAKDPLSHDPAIDSPVRSAEDLLHELQVFRIELEMQRTRSYGTPMTLWRNLATAILIIMILLRLVTLPLPSRV